jgi:lipopolysaccharide transport system permease protein
LIFEEQEGAAAVKVTWWSELWRFRELLYFLAWRDVKIRYKQAVFGAAWAVIQPLFTMLIFAFFFGRMAKIPSDGIPYPLFCYIALVPWTYFASTLAQGGNSLVNNASLITKIYFPRVLLPASAALSGLVDFGISSLFILLMMIYYKVHPGWALLLWPVAVIAMVLVSVGISMLFAATNVRYRDVKHVIPFLVQLGLFVTPVIYPPEFLPARFRPLLALNPLSGVMEAFRACLLPHRAFDMQIVVSSAVIALLLFTLGVLYFRKAERSFADII